MAGRRGGAAGSRAAPHRGRGGGSGGGPSAQAAADDPAGAAREICLRLLAVRPCTRAELDSALRRRGVADEVVAEVLDRYADVGMINDEAFARAWVTSRHQGRGLARRALAGELRRKGVAPETVGVALGEIAGSTEETTARTLVERRLKAERGALRRQTDPHARQRETAALVRRLVGLLARKGYPPGLAYRVVKDVLAADAETAAAAELLDLDLCLEDPDGVDQPGS
jgi:regulatory protein